MKRLAVLAVLVSTSALAGSATVNYNSTGSSPFRTTTDGSSNNLGNLTIFDYSAGANGWTIGSDHAGLMDLNSATTGWSADIGNVGSVTPYQGSGTANLLNLLAGIESDARGSIAAGGAIIGKVGIDQTTDGTTNGVHLVAGTAIAGKVGIDQTTDGTTNAVHLVASTASIGNVGRLSEYPAGATAETASATGTTNSTTATLAAGVAKTTYICGYSIRSNATAAVTGTATVTGIITGTMSFIQWTAPNASGLGVNEQLFRPCVPASTTNTTIAVVAPAPGTGGAVSVSAWGFQL